MTKDVAQGAAPRRSGLRRALMMAALPVALIVGGGLWWMGTGGSVATENAYLHQARLSVASEVAGRVAKVAVVDNQVVKPGDLLFQIDPEPYRIARDKAAVALDAARITVAKLQAAYAQAEAQAKLAQETAAYQVIALDRQIALSKRGVAADSALDDARHAADAAQDQAVADDMARASALASLGGNPKAPVDDHPEVRAAKAALAAAELNLRQTEVRAPAGGIIYQAASFREGQMVTVGSTLFSLVETGEVWVEANFKESQLADIRAGQTAEIRLDVARDRVLTGRVVAIGAGTGAEFSLLPAQNATGNWVKVEQRVPVRIALDDPAQAPLLASGLSAEVEVDTANPAGAAVAGTVTP